MILGSFDGDGRPYIQGRLFFPRLRLDAYVDFLVDTGADRTSLHPVDTLMMGVDYSRLRQPSDFSGIGGSAPYSSERGVLFFADGRLLRAYTTQIAILNLSVVKTAKDIPTIPSVLGRDILSNGWMRYDPRNQRLEFTPKAASITFQANLSDITSVEEFPAFVQG